MRQHARNENADGQHRQHGDDEQGLQRFAGAPQVHPDEHQVTSQVDHPAVDAHQGIDVAADEDGDGRRRQGVFEQDRHAGKVSAPGAQGPPGKAVTAPGSRQRCRKLGQAQHHAQVHDGHDRRGDQQAAETALSQAEVPAGEVARDHVGDAQTRQQHPAGGALPELAGSQVVAGDRFVLHAAAGSGRWHGTLLFDRAIE